MKANDDLSSGGGAGGGGGEMFLRQTKKFELVVGN